MRVPVRIDGSAEGTTTKHSNCAGVALAKAGLFFKDIEPAYLTPADGRVAFVGGNVDAWVAWGPFLTTTQAASNARILADSSDGLASYKRYYLASEDFANTIAKGGGTRGRPAHRVVCPRAEGRCGAGCGGRRRRAEDIGDRRAR